jgi:hypothetical protein
MPLRAMSRGLFALSLTSLAVSAALAQPKQVVKPPEAQAWIDVATFGGMGMPMGMGGMGGMPGAGGGNPMDMLGSLLGGGGRGGNSFGQTQAMSPGRWVDVTLYTRRNAQLDAAQQTVPAGFLSPALQLQSPPPAAAKPPPDPSDERPTEPDFERPKGKMLLYWGCGDKVRPGQPKVVDFATATAADMAKFFQSRRATQRGTHSSLGRPVWPNPADPRMVPAQASLVGEHAFSGAGVPEGFRFQLGAAQDLMPPIQIRQKDEAGVTRLEWAALPHARAYFITGMGMRQTGKDEGEMILWTSSEQPDIGFGLMDYQTNPAVDRWLKEQVLLAPQTTQCAVPKGVFTGEGTMLRMIAYGNETHLAHPPRPTDPKVPWEPVWAVKLRLKSVSMAMLGMDMPQAEMPDAQTPPSEPPAKPAGEKKPGVKDVLRGLFGR